jgi:exodeoxyribonuclease VII large subunit
VPDLAELRAWLDRAHEGLGRGAQRVVERHRQRLAHTHDRLRRAPLLALERRTARLENAHARLRTLSPRATLERGYAIVRSGEALVREPPTAGTALAVEVAGGSFGARSE